MRVRTPSMLVPQGSALGGAAAAVILGFALQADTHAHTVAKALPLDRPALAGEALAESLEASAGIPGSSPGVADALFWPSMEQRRYADFCDLSVPVCLLRSALERTDLNSSHGPELVDRTHATFWATDSGMAVPSICLARSNPGYRFLHSDPAAGWRAAAQWSTTGTVIFRRASAVDPACEVQVRAHRNGWRTLRFVRAGDQAGSIQSVGRFIGANTCDAQAIANEYLKCMASVGLACLPVGAEGLLQLRNEPARLLFLGLGGGSLPNFFASLLREARVVAVELDDAVVDAATSCLGVRLERVEVHTADALGWVESASQAQAQGFDLIFVDVFDSQNETPAAFYSKRFLSALRTLLSPNGGILQNMHAGTNALEDAISRAQTSYREVFTNGSCGTLPVKWKTNRVLLATPGASQFGHGSRRELVGRAREAAALLGLKTFDAADRLQAITQM